MLPLLCGSLVLWLRACYELRLTLLPLTRRRPGPCTNAAHATALVAVDRLTLKAERLQKEHDAIAQMRGTLEGWMTNIAKIRCVAETRSRLLRQGG